MKMPSVGRRPKGVARMKQLRGIAVALMAVLLSAGAGAHAGMVDHTLYATL